MLQGLGKLLQQQQQSNKVQNHHSSEPFAISSFQPVSSGQKLVIGTQSLCGVPQSEDLVTTQIGLWTSIQVCHFQCGYVAIRSQIFLLLFFGDETVELGNSKGRILTVDNWTGSSDSANCLSVTSFNRLVYSKIPHETFQRAIAIYFLCDCMSIYNLRKKRQWLVWHFTLTKRPKTT